MTRIDELLEVAPAWRRHKADVEVVVRSGAHTFTVSMPVQVAWGCSCGATVPRRCEHMAVAELSPRWWRAALELLRGGMALPLFKKIWLNTQHRFGTQVAILRMIHHAGLDGTGLRQ